MVSFSKFVTVSNPTMPLSDVITKSVNNKTSLLYSSTSSSGNIWMKTWQNDPSTGVFFDEIREVH